MVYTATRLTRFPQSLVARVNQWPPRRRELLQDGALGLVLAVVNVLSVLPYRAQQHPLWLAILLVALQGVLLVGRRWHPVLFALAIGAARVSYDQAGLLFAPFPLAVAIAYYTVMDRSGPVWRWIVTGFVAAGISVALAAPGHNEPYDAITQAFIFLTAGVAGVLTRANRASLTAAEDRAARAEAELDRESSRAAAQERATIARELHDVVAHHVSLMAVQAEAAASLLPGASRRRPSARSISSATRPGRRWASCVGCSGCCAARPSGWRRLRPRRWPSWAGSSTKCAGPGCRSTSKWWVRRLGWRPGWT